MLNGKLLYMKCSIAISIILLGGCHSFSPNKTLMASHHQEVVGPASRCVTGEGKINGVLPATLYEQMNACIVRESWSDAVYLYALAGSSTWYDAVQVDTQFARSMHTRLLKESIDALDNNQRNNFWLHIQATMSDVTQKTALCESLIALGAPTYQPDYMLLSASVNVERREPIAMNWKKAVYSYIGCDSESYLDNYSS